MENLNLLTLLQIAFSKMQAAFIKELHRAGFKDIKPAHGKVFAFIDAENGSQPIELANKAETTKQNMSKLLIELERLGYLKKTEHPNDKRASVVKLTANGEKCVLFAKIALEKIEQIISSDLSKEEYNKFRRLLEKLR